MDRRYHVFKNSVLQARILTFGKAIMFAQVLSGDVRIVNGRTKQVAWTNGGR